LIWNPLLAIDVAPLEAICYLGCNIHEVYSLMVNDSNSSKIDDRGHA
jgi:hypothetical protein